MSKVLYVDFSADNSVRVTAGAPGQRPPESQLYHCHSLGDLDTALQNFLDQADIANLMGAALSVCGWERDGAFEMPNHSYSITRNWIKERLNISRMHLINDCVAAALSIDALAGPERSVICPGKDDPNQVKALIALGRSLGMTSIVTDEVGSLMALPCAGGHSDLPVTSEREFRVFQVLAAKYGRVSRVRAVSTGGLAEVCNALRIADGAETLPDLKGRDVVSLARAGDAHAKEAIAMVTGWLAATASDVALINGARGGIFLAGSFFDVVGDQFDEALFASRFCDKGRLMTYVEDIPVYLVKVAEPEMVGLSTLFGSSNSFQIYGFDKPVATSC